jgi:hypothetical protein
MRGKLTLSEPFAASAMLVLCVVLAGLSFARPRAVTPRELPSLRLSAHDVREVMVADAAAAQAAPRSARAQSVEALLMRHGAIEAKGPEDLDTNTERKAALAAGYREVVAEVGDKSALRLRAKNVQQIDAALELRLPEAEAKQVLGSLPRILALEGATRDGYLVAPRFLVRTFAKARWNLLHGFRAVYELAPVERRAYYGWQGLHAERLPIAQRIRALQSYVETGGSDADEALGVLLLRQHESDLAAQAFMAAMRRADNLRLRNYLLAARVEGR